MNALKTQSLVSLSEEYLVDCDNTDCGVFGGWPHNAMGYVISSGGLETEAEYPYCCGTGACYPCMADKNKTFCGPPPPSCSRHCLASSNATRVQIDSWVRTCDMQESSLTLL